MEHVTYCRICSAACGLIVDVHGERVRSVRGDPAHPLTRGFTCAKGRRIGDLHHDATRVLTSMRRTSGGHEPIDVDRAIAEIAAHLGEIVAAHGPDAVALFIGTQTYGATLTHPFAAAWFRALGSRSRFSTMTVDQSAKWVAAGRLGSWWGGRQRFEDADVWLLAGTNPLVSMQGGDLTGFPVHDGRRRLAEARHRGLQLIVVDPRRTETAANADLHLQLRPGTDAVLYAGLLHVILNEGLNDPEFCDRWVDGLHELRSAVAPADPATVAAVTGLAEDDIEGAARVFGQGCRGMATSGTGPDMGPWSNLAEHLLTAMNVVCGRYPRAGDRHASAAALKAPARPRAAATGPNRTWESDEGRHGLLFGELPSALLPGGILDPGPDRIRALVVSGGNPAAVFPDPETTRRALAGLDLLVTVDPFPTETASLAHYVIAPAMALERPDHTRPYETLYDTPFAQYTAPVLPRPPGVVEDWQFFSRLAGAMGLTLSIGRHRIAPGDPEPTSDEVLTWFAERGRVDYAEVARHPSGRVFADVSPVLVAEAGDDDRARFDLLPADVAGELAAALAGERIALPPERPLMLVVRRARETMNTLGRRLPGLASAPPNPLHAHPEDLASLDLVPGDEVTVTSAHGSIRAVVGADTTLRPGVVALTHGFGDGDTDDPWTVGANPARLLALDDAETINAMPRMTAVPVRLEACPRP